MKIKNWKDYEKKAKDEINNAKKNLCKILKKKELSVDEIEAVKLFINIVCGYDSVKTAFVEKLSNIYRYNDMV